MPYCDISYLHSTLIIPFHDVIKPVGNKVFKYSYKNCFIAKTINHPHPQYNKYLDPRKFSRFTIENGNIVWGKNWDFVFPMEQLHAGRILV